MRVTIDWQLCVGSGMCVAAVPDGFELAPCGRNRPGNSLRQPGDASLRAAAAACPTLAFAYWMTRARRSSAAAGDDAAS